MRRRCVLLLAALVNCGLPSSPKPQNIDLNGSFSGTLTPTVAPGQTDSCGTGSLTVVLQQNDSTISGSWTVSGWASSGSCPSLDGSGTISGTLIGSGVFLSLTSTNMVTEGYTVSGQVYTAPGQGTAIDGQYSESLYANSASGGTVVISNR